MSPNVLFKLFIICLVVAVIGSGLYFGSRIAGRPRSGRYLVFLANAWAASSIFLTMSLDPKKMTVMQQNYAGTFALSLLAIGLFCGLKALPRRQR